MMEYLQFAYELIEVLSPTTADLGGYFVFSILILVVLVVAEVGLREDSPDD